MMRGVPVLLFAGLAGPVAAQWSPATERKATAAYSECLKTGDAARGITSALMSCNGEEIDRQDAVLNQTYKAALARLSVARQDTLRVSQRAWIERRDAAAKAAGDSAGGGSAAGLEYSSTILSQTINRTIWLENYR